MAHAIEVATKLTIPDLATLFNDAFKGYIGGDAHFTSATFLKWLATENVDLNASFVYLDGEQPLGFCLVAQQGWTNRIAVMGMIPAAQSQGSGKVFFTEVLARLKERKIRLVVLEAFEQNTRAVRLYTSLGFTIVRRLYGYELQAEGGTAAELTEVDTTEMASVVWRDGLPNLGWQVAAPYILRFAPPQMAVRLDSAYALLTNPANETIVLRNFIVAAAARRQGQGKRLFAALCAAYPNKRWFVPQIFPEEMDGFWQALGFKRLELQQVQMEVKLS